jgi:hypothetical protein
MGSRAERALRALGGAQLTPRRTARIHARSTARVRYFRARWQIIISIDRKANAPWMIML